MLFNCEQFYVFGDSLSDTSNAFNLTGGIVPGDRHYNASRRFSNGDIWVDSVAEKVNLTIAPFTQNTGLNDGLNFAIGGANSDDSNFSGQLPGLAQQIDTFKKFANNQSTPETFEDDLFSITIGANDYFSFIQDDPTTTDVVETNFPQPGRERRHAVIEVVEINIKGAIQEIIDAGGKNIVVFNLPDLNETPLGQSLNGQDQRELKRLTKMHNRRLSRLIGKTEKANPDVNIIEVDLHDLFDEIKDEPNKFGFTNVTDNFSGIDLYTALPIIGAGENENVNEYLFCDSVHPTTKIHSLVADLVIEQLTNEGLIVE